MNKRLLVMAGLALGFGGVSYIAGSAFLEAQARSTPVAAEAPPAMPMTTVVVAETAFGFGETLAGARLKEAPWPAEAVPEGAFRTIAELTAGGERKVLKSIAPGEPVLAVKLTGGNGRAGLSDMISEGMRAVTMPVDLVNGVGGFVLPGDRVDIVLTKVDRDSGEQAARIILENVRVLSIDQSLDGASQAPREAKSVTLETDSAGAQKLALANSVGRLSLLLRSSGDAGPVAATDLSAGELDGRAALPPPAAGAPADDSLLSLIKDEEKKPVTTITVVNRATSVTHNVPVDGKRQRTVAGDRN